MPACPQYIEETGLDLFAMPVKVYQQGVSAPVN